MHASLSLSNRAPAPRESTALSVGPSKLSSKVYDEVDMILGELNAGRKGTSIDGFNAYRHELPASLERR